MNPKDGDYGKRRVKFSLTGIEGLRTRALLLSVDTHSL